MTDDQKPTVRSEDVEKVLSALANEAWDFRTVGGLAKETNLSPDTVQAALEQSSEQVRRSAVPGPAGQDLYTLSEPSLREAFSVARGAISKSS